MICEVASHEGMKRVFIVRNVVQEILVRFVVVFRW